MLVFLAVFMFFSLVAAVLISSVIIGLIKTRGTPFVSTSKWDFDSIFKALDIKPGQKIYDLGCGKAHLLIRAAKKYGAKGIGYELSLWPYLWAKFNIWLSKADVKVYLKNFFNVNLADADIIFCYLFPHLMLKLEPKFKNELRPGSKVVSYGFPLPQFEPAKIIYTRGDNVELGRIFIYHF